LCAYEQIIFTLNNVMRITTSDLRRNAAELVARPVAA